MLDPIEAIKEKFHSLEMDAVPACYLIWKDPYMTIGGDTLRDGIAFRTGPSNSVLVGKIAIYGVPLHTT